VNVPRDRPPVVLRPGRFGPGPAAVRRRGGGRHARPDGVGYLAREPLSDGPTRSLDLRLQRPMLLRDRLRAGQQAARRDPGPDGVTRLLGGDPPLYLRI